MTFKNNSQVQWVGSLEDVNGSTVPNNPDIGISPVNRCINDIWGNTDDNRLSISTANGAITTNSNSITTINNDGATKIVGIGSAGNSKYYGTNAIGTPGFYDLPAGGGGSGDMLKATYDTNNNGKVDGADQADKVVGLTGSGNSKYYGTNASGNGGFYDLPSAGAGDMLKSVYDTNNNGIVDKTTEVDGVQASSNSTYYGKNSGGGVGFHALPSGGIPSRKRRVFINAGTFNVPAGVTEITLIATGPGGSGNQSSLQNTGGGGGGGTAEAFITLTSADTITFAVSHGFDTVVTILNQTGNMTGIRGGNSPGGAIPGIGRGATCSLSGLVSNSLVNKQGGGGSYQTGGSSSYGGGAVGSSGFPGVGGGGASDSSNYINGVGQVIIEWFE